MVFLHHFGGNLVTNRRHIKMVNEMGFDALSFNLSHNFGKKLDLGFIKAVVSATAATGGLPHIWKDDTLEALNIEGIPKSRPIVFYSFSSPSLAIPFLVTDSSLNVKAWICDGGPFFSFTFSFFAFFYRHLKIRNPFLIGPLMTTTLATWHGWNLKTNVRKALGAFKKGFPVLSIRGLSDPLVPEGGIRAVFKRQPHLNVTEYIIPHGGHINGLFCDSDNYQKRVEQFLDFAATEAKVKQAAN